MIYGNKQQLSEVKVDAKMLVVEDTNSFADLRKPNYHENITRIKQQHVRKILAT